MTNFTTTRPHDATCFSHGEIREVVVKNEFLLGATTGVGIKTLGVINRAQSGEGVGERFTASKRGRTVSARNDARLGFQFTQIVESTTVKTLRIVQDERAYRFFLNEVKRVTNNLGGDFLFTVFFNQLLANFFLDRLARRLALRLHRNEQRGGSYDRRPWLSHRSGPHPERNR